MLDREMMIKRNSRGSYADDIFSTIDDIRSAISNMDERLMMKINQIKSVVKKYESEAPNFWNYMH